MRGPPTLPAKYGSRTPRPHSTSTVAIATHCRGQFEQRGPHDSHDVGQEPPEQPLDPSVRPSKVADSAADTVSSMSANPNPPSQKRLIPILRLSDRLLPSRVARWT